VNAVAFSPDGREIFAALLHREAQGVDSASGAPEVSLYHSVRTEAGGWSAPTLMPFSGRFEDYEPAVAPDGSMLVFNSRRPHDDGRTSRHNDLWVVRREGAGWGAPRMIRELSTFDADESYATLTRDGRIIFHVWRALGGSRGRSDLYEARLRDGRFQAPTRLPLSTDDLAEGDPWVAPDGSYLVFTRWPQEGDWQTTCDLYIAFADGVRWTSAVPLTELNTPGPDYAVTVSPDGERVFYRAGNEYIERPFAPVLAAARARVGRRGR
jgi:Tol biopolymer transport system component